MPDLMLVKSFGALKPCDPASEDYLKTLGVGQIVRCKVSKPRNGAFHRKVFALLQVGYENQNDYNDFEKFRRAVVIEAGYFEDLRLIDGRTQREAKSLSYASMDEMEFSRFFNAAHKVIADFLGTDDSLLAQEIQQFMTVGAG